jgi:hypothetical protein
MSFRSQTDSLLAPIHWQCSPLLKIAVPMEFLVATVDLASERRLEGDRRALSMSGQRPRRAVVHGA